MSHRFLDFRKLDRSSSDKSYPGPGLNSFPHEPTGALPEEDRWSGPTNNLSGGDSTRGPGHFVKDVSDFEKGTGTGSGSKFKSVKNVIPPRAIPR